LTITKTGIRSWTLGFFINSFLNDSKELISYTDTRL
jgi:hypothetical protein